MIFRRLFRIGIISVCIGCLAGGVAIAQNDMTSRKRALTEKLDSIDLEKQLRKRRGESLEDLERTADSIKDTIAAIKGKMPVPERPNEAMTDSAKPGAAAAGNGSGWLAMLQKYLPHTFFDWLVAIVGFIAIVSGIVLFAGILGMVSKRFKKRPEAPPVPKTLHEIFPRSVAADAYAGFPKVAKRQAEEKDEAINTIRKRIEESAPQDEGILATVDEASSGLGPFTPEARPDANSEEGGRLVKDPSQLKQQVVRAAQQGLDNQEISQRFHVSLDEVSLILRLSRQGSRPESDRPAR